MKTQIYCGVLALVFLFSSGTKKEVINDYASAQEVSGEEALNQIVGAENSLAISKEVREQLINTFESGYSNWK